MLNAYQFCPLGSILFLVARYIHRTYGRKKLTDDTFNLYISESLLSTEKSLN